MNMKALFYTFLVLVSLSLFIVKSCPSQCNCTCEELIIYCNNSNITNSELKEIAQGLPLNTTEINFTGNLISEFLVTLFSNLTDLTDINLSHNKITTVPSNISQYLPNVDDLDLSFNQIKQIRKKDFVRYENLEILKLQNNRISKLTSEVFGHLTALTALSLNDNNISSISKNAFKGLANLNYLNLFQNPFSKIENGTFADTPLIELNIYNTKLKTIPSYFVTEKRLISTLNLENNSITYIHENAFYNSKIAGLLLPNNNITILNKEMFTGSTLIERLDLSGNNLRCDCNMSKFLKPLNTKEVIGFCSSPPVVAGQDLKTFTRNNISCTSCSNLPCKNNAICKPIDKKTFNCDCAKGYIGKLCGTVDYCYYVTCEHNSTCALRNNSAGFLCNCSQGFQGETCEKEIPCFKNYCKNNGTCEILGTTNYKCNCTESYHGEHCEELKIKKQKQTVISLGWVALIVTISSVVFIAIIITIVMRRRNTGRVNITEITPLQKTYMSIGYYNRIVDTKFKHRKDICQNRTQSF